MAKRLKTSSSSGTITVETLDRRSCSAEITSPQFCALDLMKQVQAKLGINMAQQRLYYEHGNLLQNEDIIAKPGVKVLCRLAVDEKDTLKEIGLQTGWRTRLLGNINTGLPYFHEHNRSGNLVGLGFRADEGFTDDELHRPCEAIDQLDYLTMAGFDGFWHLERLPEWTTRVPLHGLAIVHGSLWRLPLEVGQLTSLTALDVSHNGISELQSFIGNLKNLKHLDISGNNLTEFPQALCTLPKLETLEMGCFTPERCDEDMMCGEYVADADMLLLPDSVWQLSNLRELTANFRGIQALDGPMCNHGLTHLNLYGNCFLRELPPSIDNLHRVVCIDLSYCGIETLPKSFGNLVALERLDLHGNFDLRDLPAALGNLSALEHLDVESCSLLRINHEAAQNLQSLKHVAVGNDRRHLQNLMRVESNVERDMIADGWSGNSLQELPCAVWHGASVLTGLSARGCDLRCLPGQLSSLSGLEWLDISNNAKLTVLPDAICQLTKLTVLRAVKCGLKALPNSIGTLSALTLLDVSGNPQLEAFPDAVCQLAALEQLYVNSCNLEALPSATGNLQALTRLHAHSNRELHQLPRSLKNIPGLVHFNIQSCGLQRFPDWLLPPKKRKVGLGNRPRTGLDPYGTEGWLVGEPRW